MNYIIIYLEVKHLLNFLSKEDKGNLLDVLIEYGETEKLPECNQNVLNVFNYLKPRLDSQREKAKIKAKVARENGISGGRPKVNKKPKQTQPKPKKTKIGFIPPILQEVRDYCRERSSSVNPDKFFDHYHVANWKDNKGNQVLNWKQKVISWEGRDAKNKKGVDIHARQENPFVNHLNAFIGQNLIKQLFENQGDVSVKLYSATDCDKWRILPEEVRNEVLSKVKAKFNKEPKIRF